jgi:hypothetical protein
MNDANLILGILNISCGAIFILLSIPLIMKKIPLNRYYGFRFSKALESSETWYAINQYGGRQMIRWSLFLIAIGALYFSFPMDTANSELRNTLTAAGPIVICPGVAVVKTLLFSRQI